MRNHLRLAVNTARPKNSSLPTLCEPTQYEGRVQHGEKRKREKKTRRVEGPVAEGERLPAMWPTFRRTQRATPPPKLGREKEREGERERVLDGGGLGDKKQPPIVGRHRLSLTDARAERSCGTVPSLCEGYKNEERRKERHEAMRTEREVGDTNDLVTRLLRQGTLLVEERAHRTHRSGSASSEKAPSRLR
ncbi:hypothetical protein HPB51_024862 [Rhipicephalus microplus]|uniref:Uncharacterized protein n=1 Tax=Rhipicephalus microplus TaxID=6941 RepID=A0A9J6F8C5_RHIMP|nr:hypothetical protein HPB51_024862 [Rhipicephalus microplus]